jgi:AraC family transcriptional regulator
MDDTMHEVTIMDVPPQLVFGMRRKGKYEQIAVMIAELVHYISQAGVDLCGPPIYLWHEKTVEAAYRADEAGNADIEVAWPVRGTAPGTPEIRQYTLPGGKMARILHQGPYQECGSTYQYLFDWLDRNRLVIIGPIREMYLNDPVTVPPEGILTEILAPVSSRE